MPAWLLMGAGLVFASKAARMQGAVGWLWLLSGVLCAVLAWALMIIQEGPPCPSA